MPIDGTKEDDVVGNRCNCLKGFVLIRVAIVVAIAAGVILPAVVGCGGGSGSGGGLGLQNVKVDGGAKASGTIDSEGGSITATSNDGTQFRLEVPENALDASTTISVYPVRSVATAPFSEGILGAFHLEPSGLVFAKPAKLTVTYPAGIDVSTLKPFLYTGDGDQLHMEPTSVSGQEVIFDVNHFSGGGGGKGPGVPAPASAEAVARQAIFQHMNAQLLAGEPLDTQFITGILADWYQTSIKPGLVAVDAAPAGYASMRMPKVFAEWRSWLQLADAGPFSPSEVATISTNLEPEKTEARGLAAKAIRKVFDFANAESAVAESLERVKVALYWYRHAVLFDVDDLENMGIDQIRQDLACELFVQSVNFPQQLPEGQSGNLDVTVGYRFDGGPIHFTKMVATYTTSGTVEPSGQGATSNNSGRLQKTFTRQSDQTDLVVDAQISFEDIPLRTTAKRDFPNPILFTSVHVVRSSSGGGNTPPIWDLLYNRHDIGIEGTMKEIHRNLDDNGDIVEDSITYSAKYIQFEPRFQATSGKALRFLTWHEDPNAYNNFYIWVTESFPDGTFTCLPPDNQPGDEGCEITVQPGDAKFEYQFKTRPDGSKYTAIVFNAKFRMTVLPGNDPSLGTFWEFTGTPTFLWEGWNGPSD